MASRQWYTAIGGEQAGPYSDEQLLELVAAGKVRADTFVWCSGMKDWAAAAEIPGLMPRSRPAPPPPPRQAARPAMSSQTAGRAAPAQHDGQALNADVPMWPLLGRTLLVAIGQILIVPSPWTTTSYYRWFVEHIELPGQERAAFAGKPADIWYIFMLSAACAYLGYAGYYLHWLALPLTAFFLVIIMRWFWQNLVWQGQTAPLRFTGDYLPMIGWYLLTALSVITIIGWAWVAVAWLRWICRHIEGSERQLLFTASGWDLLWRSWLFGLSCIVIVPIPWTLHWYVRWLISQFALSSEPRQA